MLRMKMMRGGSLTRPRAEFSFARLFNHTLEPIAKVAKAAELWEREASASRDYSGIFGVKLQFYAARCLFSRSGSFALPDWRKVFRLLQLAPLCQISSSLYVTTYEFLGE